MPNTPRKPDEALMTAPVLPGQDPNAELDPEVSVASAGEGNRYGHPSQTCVDALEGAGSTFLCTMDVGDVTVMPGEAGPRVRVASPANLACD